MTTAQISGKRVEDLSQRNETTKFYANPDGTWTSEGATEPVRVQDDKGVWHDIDTTLVATPDGVQPKYAPADLVFSDGSGDEPFATLTEDKKDLGFSWPTDLPEPVLDGSTATYKDVKPGQDLVVTATNVGFEYSLVLNEKPTEPVVLATPIDTDGAKLTETANGGVTITANGDTVATSAQPIMYDSSETSEGDPASVGLDTDITKDVSGSPQLSVAADQAFLDNPATVYPVTVDPTVQIFDNGDSYVENTGPTSGNSGSPELRVGTYDGGTHKARSFMRFDSAPYAGKQILSAGLTLFNSQSVTCNALNIEASRITNDWAPGSLSWTNQPGGGANPSYYGPAYGATKSSACGNGGYARWDVTGIVQAWVAGNPNYGIRLQATNGTSNDSWRIYYSDNSGSAGSNPHINVTYNTTPNVPATPTVGGVGVYTAPGNSASDYYTATSKPTFSAVATDPDGGNTSVNFYVLNSAGTVVDHCYSPFVASGSLSTCTMTTSLTNGGTYRVYGQTSDGMIVSGSSANSAPFTVAEGVPPAPVVTCPGYANNTWTDTPPTSDLTCTVTAASSGPSAAGSIDYTVDGDTKQHVVITRSSDANIAKTTFTVSKRDGGHAILATAISASGVPSDASGGKYGFGYGKAGITTNGGSAPVTATKQVSIKAAGPPSAGGSGVPPVRLQWRPAGSGGDASTGWLSGETGNLTVTNDANAGVQITGTWDATTAKFNATGQPDNAATSDSLARVPVLLEVQICVDYASGTQCSWTTGKYQVQRVAHAFGDGFPTSEVAGGQVALWTGEFQTSATDVTLPGDGTTLTLSRSAATYDGPPASAAAKVFGQGWTASLDGSDAGMADLQVIDATRRDGTITTTDAEGSVMVFVPATGQAKRTDIATDLTQGAWKPIDEDTVESGITAQLSGTGSSTLFTIKDIDGTTTAFKAVTAPGAGTDAVFAPWAINQPGTAGKTTYAYDAQSRVTRILAPVPTGVTCPDSGTLPDGCRAITISYAASSTAPPTILGDYANQVKSISSVIGGSTSLVASYQYDPFGRLAKFTDERNQLTTTYTYDGSSNRLASMTPPGLKPVTYEYDSSNRLQRVKREQPNASDGIATLATIIYNIQRDGTGGVPNLSAGTISAWGQTSVPTYGAAVFGADHPIANVNSVGVDEWKSASFSYTDAKGYTINSANYGAGDWQYTSADWDATGHPVRQLDAGDIAAIKSGSVLPGDAGTLTVYNSQHGTTGAVTLPAGSVVTDIYGPARWVVLSDGSRTLARPRTHTDYDETSPTGGINADTNQEWAMPTTTTVTAVNSANLATLDTLSVTKSTYSDAVAGDPLAGWKQGLVGTSTQVMAGTGADIASITRYDARGRVIEQRQPKSNGADAGSRQTVYYSADANSAYPLCGNKPAWSGAVCATGYAGVTSTGAGLINTYVDYYNALLQPLMTTETANGTTRKTTMTYRNDGAVTSSQVVQTPTGSTTATPTFAYQYATDTGLLTSTTATGTGAGAPVTTGYDSWGRATTYSSAAGETTTTGYDLAGRISTVADPKGTSTYTYNGTDAAGNVEYRGLPTKLEISNPGGTAVVIKGGYNADGLLTKQSLPGGINQRWTYDPAGEPTGLTYSGQVSTDNGDGTFTTTPDSAWLGWTQNNDVLGRVRRDWTPSGSAFKAQTGNAAGFARQYTYDRASRLTRVVDQTAGQGAGVVDPDSASVTTPTSCVIRDYAFDTDGNRTSLTRTPSGAGGTCQTGASPTGVTTKSSAYDVADRLTTAGYVYDTLGRVTTMPQGDTPAAQNGATPGALTLGYYDSDAVRTITQNSTTTTFTLDTAGRRLVSTKGPTSGAVAQTIIRHYTDSSDNPAWTDTVVGGTTTTERYAEGLGGGLSLTIQANGTVQLPLTDLHGDVVSQVTAPSNSVAVAIDNWQDGDEYGNPLVVAPGTTPTSGDGTGISYGWVGGQQRATDSTGVLLMGARVYDPAIGVFTSPDPLFGGNSSAYAYPQDPINVYDLNGAWGCSWCGKAVKSTVQFFSARDDIKTANYLRKGDVKKAGESLLGTAPSHAQGLAAAEANKRYGSYGRHSATTILGTVVKKVVRVVAKSYGAPAAAVATAADYALYSKPKGKPTAPGKIASSYQANRYRYS